MRFYRAETKEANKSMNFVSFRNLVQSVECNLCCAAKKVKVCCGPRCLCQKREQDSKFWTFACGRNILQKFKPIKVDAITSEILFYSLSKCKHRELNAKMKRIQCVTDDCGCKTKE